MQTSLKSFRKHFAFGKLSGGLIGLVLLLGPALTSVRATSLWDENVNGGRSLYADRRAFRRGDLVTIVVNQSTVAAKNQNTTTEKKVSEAEQLSALGVPLTGGVRPAADFLRLDPHNAWSGDRTFSGGGTLAHTETLTSTIQARVTDALPNGILRIEATRRVEVGQETSQLVLAGLIRQEDLTPANTILSTQVADLQVRNLSNGTISREQKKGWLTRIWETVTPF